MACPKENLQNVTIVEQEPLDLVNYSEMYSSPDVYNGSVPDVSGMSLDTPTQTTPAMAEAAQGLCQLSGGNNARREREDISPVQPRKRVRPNSNDMSLQDNVRELLSLKDGEDCTTALEDPRRIADPFSSSTKLISLAQPSPSERTPVPMPSKGTRKRARCAPDAAAKMLRKELSLQSPVV